MNLTFESSPSYSNEAGKGFLKQKNTGAFYTPYWLAYRLVQICMSKLKIGKTFKVIDPACGEGVFLVAAADYLVKEKNIHPREVAKMIFGADLENEACKKTKYNLETYFEQISTHEDMKEIKSQINKNIKLCDSIKHFGFNSELKFDLVVGNPPWRIQRNRRDFDEETGTSNFKRKTDKQLIEARMNWNLSVDSVECEDADIYLGFLRLANRIRTTNGCIGYILPDSFLLNSNAQPMRTEFLTKQSVYIEGYTNTKKAFDADSRKKFELFVAYANKNTTTIEIAFGGNAGRALLESKIPTPMIVTSTFLKKFSNKFIVPDIRNKEELNILKKCVSQGSKLETYLNDKVNTESNEANKIIRGADIQFLESNFTPDFNSEIIWRKITKDDNTRTLLVNLIKRNQAYDKNSVHKIGCKDNSLLFSIFAFMNSTICDFLLKTQITVNATRESIRDLPCPNFESQKIKSLGLVYALGIFKVSEHQLLNYYSPLEVKFARKLLKSLNGEIEIFKYCESQLCSFFKISNSEFKRIQEDRFKSFNTKCLEAA